MEFEYRLSVGERADDLYLAARVAHRIAHTLAKAVLKPLRLVDYPDPVEQRHLKAVLHTGDGAALEYVIRRNSGTGEPSEELAEHLRRIVDAAQQHGLVAHLHAAVEQCAHRAQRFTRKLPRVVKLCDDVDRLYVGVLIEHVEQLAVSVDALRQRDRQARAEADKVKVVYCRQLPQIALNDVVRVQQRIPAGDEDVVYLRVAADVFNDLIDALVEFLIAQADEPFAEAVAAVHRALVRREQQDCAFILVLQALKLRVRGLAARVERAARHELIRRGDAHARYRIIGIVLIYQREVIRRYHHRVALGDLPARFKFLLIPSHVFRELLRGSYSFAQLFLPAHILYLPFIS